MGMLRTIQSFCLFSRKTLNTENCMKVLVYNIGINKKFNPAHKCIFNKCNFNNINLSTVNIIKPYNVGPVLNHYVRAMQVALLNISIKICINIIY